MCKHKDEFHISSLQTEFVSPKLKVRCYEVQFLGSDTNVRPFFLLQELKDVLTSVPEIGEIVGDEHVDRIMTLKETDACEEIKIALQSIYTKLMLASQETVSEHVSKLMHRLNAENKVHRSSGFFF